MSRLLRIRSSYILFLMALLFSSETICATVTSEDDKANGLFERITDEWLARSPSLQLELGIKTDADKWDTVSDAFEVATNELKKRQLQALSLIDRKKLTPPVALSYDLLRQQLTSEIAFFKWRLYNYPVNQMSGWHSKVPSTLINLHNIETVKDADNYIARLNGVGQLFDDVIMALKLRAERGIMAPSFVYPKVIDDCKNLLKGQPFDEGEDSTLLSDFTKKIALLKISDAERMALVKRARSALSGVVAPAYLRLIASLQALEKKSDSRAGVWKFPQGEAFYNDALRRTTTTDLTADEIHSIGLREVARIQNEMLGIMERVKFKGNLAAFFTFMETSDQFYLPNTEAGRAEYLKRVGIIIDTVVGRLDELFITKPKAALTVKRVEVFREKSAGTAFYKSPPTDGSRPGIYYVNLHDMRNRAIYNMESLAYHEAIPGHHLQLSITSELGDVPRFRKLSSYTAYNEGWGLYAELLPKEIGLYQDPYSDFGRLEAELWRACRLVVDTGLHDKKWSYDQALKYLRENTPRNEKSLMKAVERYIVMPSQATSYKIGMLKILELREKVKQKQKDKFDIRLFHERVLRLGSVPLNVLEQSVLAD